VKNLERWLKDWQAEAAADPLPLREACRAISACLLQGGMVLSAGNGGSAADAQHLAAEFVGRFRRERAPMPAVALTTDTSCLTSLANDYGYDEIFSRQVVALGSSGDVLVAISTSGRSRNVIRAAQEAHARGLKVIALTGRDGGELAEAADVTVAAPSRETAHVQEWHTAALHAICEVCEELWTRAPVIPLLKRAGLLSRQAAAARCALAREAGVRVAFTNGCFDILHPGHIATFEHAAGLADCLVIGLNSDESVRRLKGEGRPAVGQDARAVVLAALERVDAVVVFEEDTPLELIRALQPDLLVKGADYPEAEIVGAAEVRSWGGRVERVPLVGDYCSTKIIKELRRGRADSKGG